MTTETLIPQLTSQFFANNGTFLSNGLLYSYVAGSTTPAPTYTDSTGGTANTNPIVLNARGECSVWVPGNTGYKFVLTDSAGNTIWTRDQVFNAQLLSLYAGVDTGSVNAYQIAFSSPVGTLQNGLVLYWIPANNNNSAAGASTLAVSLNNGLSYQTPVTIVNPNGSAIGSNQIVAGQTTTVMYYAGTFQLISNGNFTGNTIGTFGTETPIASAATTDLGTALAHVAVVTGTTTITSFGSSATLLAPIYTVRFAASLTLTYGPNIILPGAGNIVTQPGDACIAQYLGSGVWKVLLYQSATGATSNTRIKPATTTVTSSTLAPDPDLYTSTLAVGRYAWEIMLVFDNGTAANGFQWTNGGTAVDSRGVAPSLGYGNVNGTAYANLQSPYGSTITYATVATAVNGNAVCYKGSLLVSTAGTFGVNWAAAAGSSACNLRAGSYLTASLVNTGTSNSAVQHLYATATTGTETIPAGYNTCTVEVWGGTGNGGGSKYGVLSGQSAGGGGGGSGGYSRSVFSVTGLAGDTFNYAVGTIATASTVTNGTFPTSVSMSAGGGVNGVDAPTSSSSGAGGAGGTATGGNAVNTTGTHGGGGSLAAGGIGGAALSGVFTGGTVGGNGGYNSSYAVPGNPGNPGLISFTYQ